MYKVHWALHSISLPSAVVVTAVFWAVVYDPGIPVKRPNTTATDSSCFSSASYRLGERNGACIQYADTNDWFFTGWTSVSSSSLLLDIFLRPKLSHFHSYLFFGRRNWYVRQFFFQHPCFTLFYNSYDRPFIYKILDWRSPLPAAATVLGVLVFMCIIHVLFWAIQLLKDWVKRRCWAATAGRYAEGQENLGMDHKPISTINVV